MTERGGAAGEGVIYSFADGLPRFATPVNRSGPVGATVNILGTGFAQGSCGNNRTRHCHDIHRHAAER
jgi:hypothetical protein